ncbi:MAG: hypothetical protein U5L06_00335 [Rhodovibrio sp.]|nr:hypothetical protein [Rhodovibrio sp.]
MRLENRFQWIGDLDDMRTDRREEVIAVDTSVWINFLKRDAWA